MATITVTNISSNSLYLRDCYKELSASDSFSFVRAWSDLSRMKNLLELKKQGKITVTFSLDNEELLNNLVTPLSPVIRTNDLQPHANEHLPGGNDPIPLATESTAGLLSAIDKTVINNISTTGPAIENVLTVALSGAVNYNSISEAVVAGTDLLNNGADDVLIQVYPGTYTEESFTIPYGMTVSAVEGDITTPCLILASNPNEDLITLNGGSLVGFDVKGVTNILKCLIRVGDSNTFPSVIKGCSFSGCAIGILIENNAILYAINNAVIINDIDEQVILAGIKIDGSSLYVEGLVIDAPSILLGVYAPNNPIEKGVYITNGSNVSLSNFSYRAFGNTVNQVAVYVDGGSDISIQSAVFENSSIAVQIGSLGLDTKISILSGYFKNNDTNFKIDSATGIIYLNGSVENIQKDIIPGGILTGVFQIRDHNQTELAGEIQIRFPSDREINVLNFVHDQTSSGLRDGGALSKSGNLTVTVASGLGWVHRGEPNNDIKDVTWDETVLTLSANDTSYIYYDDILGIITNSISLPGDENIILGSAITDGSTVRFLHSIPFLSLKTDQAIQKYLQQTSKVKWIAGLAVSVGSSASKFSIDAGSYFRVLYTITFAGDTDAVFSYFYGSNGLTEISNQTNINTTQYDNAGILTTMTDAFYRTDTVILTSDGRISVILGTSEFDLQENAEDVSPAIAPSFMEDSALVLATLIVQKTTGIISIIDYRRTPSLFGDSVPAADHGLLTGLLDDDHTQYLLTTGTRPMGGDLDLNNNNIINTATINGIDLGTHSFRHLPGGLDALATAIPENLIAGATASEGNNASFARSNHQHGVPVAAPVTISTANNVGVSTSLSRADHVHAHGNLAGGSLHANVISNGAAGFMTGADKAKLDQLPLLSKTYDSSNFAVTSASSWAVNTKSNTITDPALNSLSVQQFSSSSEQGVGFFVSLPTNTTSFILKLKSKARVAPGLSSKVGLKLYYKEIPDNAVIGSWNSKVLTDIDFPTNINYQYDSQTILFSAFSPAINAGSMYQFELTRIAPSVGTNLANDWLLLEATIEIF